MVSITLSVPDEVRELMKRFPEVNWSGLVRKMIVEKAKALNIKEKMINDLGREKEFNSWAVEVVRKGRKK